MTGPSLSSARMSRSRTRSQISLHFITFGVQSHRPGRRAPNSWLRSLGACRIFPCTTRRPAGLLLCGVIWTPIANQPVSVQCGSVLKTGFSECGLYSRVLGVLTPSSKWSDSAISNSMSNKSRSSSERELKTFSAAHCQPSGPSASFSILSRTFEYTLNFHTVFHLNSTEKLGPVSDFPFPTLLQ